MTSQAQMFPLSEEERIGRIRSLLAKDEEKTKGKRDVAFAALDEATEAFVLAAAMLETFDAMSGVVAAAYAAYATPEGVDPTTGEIDAPADVDEATGTEAEKQEPATWTRACTACEGEGRLPDKTGGGNHQCRECKGKGRIVVEKPDAGPVVVVLYPGDDEPHVVEVGEHTRYSNLVYAYLSRPGGAGDVDADEWAVRAEDELTDEERSYGNRSLVETIMERDYGKRLLVVAADQGSVTGTPPIDVVDEATGDEITDTCIGADCAHYCFVDDETEEGSCGREDEPRQVKAGESDCSDPDLATAARS